MHDEELLGKIAYEWRYNHDSKLIDEYAQAVDRLIKSGKWVDSPPPEDQLPHEMMPQAFFDYWCMERKPVFQDPEPYISVVIGIAFWVALIGGIVFIISILVKNG